MNKPQQWPQEDAKSITARLVAPALNAIASLRQGEISWQALGDLIAMSKLAVLARMRQMTAPRNNKAIDDLTHLIAAAFTAGGSVMLDEDVIDRCDAWLVRLEEQLRCAQDQDLLLLIDDLVLYSMLAEAEANTAGLA